MRKACFMLFAMLLSLPLYGQQSVAEASARAKGSPALPQDAATQAEINTLIELTQTRKTMAVALESTKQIMKQAAEENFRKRVPNPTAKQLEALNGIYDDIADMPLDEMVNAVISIYQHHFSKTDVEEMIRFYSSPLGQKLLREMPQILQESMQAGAEIQRKRMDELNTKIEARIQQMLDTTDENHATPKK
ncbi:MAG TPA: DUF2059 domain-containing protein [Candidatus Angelobacter sp.]|jgi:hypothetical protein|nr:DUF2059 domain-containing protein [Candidatus Angelobacter sp.]